jgi:hypothetical protein
LVAVCNLSLQSGELSNPASSLDLQNGVVDSRINLNIRSRVHVAEILPATYLEELVDGRVKLVASLSVTFLFNRSPKEKPLTHGSSEVKPLTSLSISCLTLLASIAIL